MAPLQPDLVDRLGLDLAPFCSTSGLLFSSACDVHQGPWRNYFVGLVGEVAVVEDEILWPNQVRTGGGGTGLAGGDVPGHCLDHSPALATHTPTERGCQSQEPSQPLHSAPHMPAPHTPPSAHLTLAPTPPSTPTPHPQVLHRDRVLYNVRSAWDVAKFLADPQLEDVVEHRQNLERLAADRGYRRGWCWHMLRTRWGGAALRQLGLTSQGL